MTITTLLSVASYLGMHYFPMSLGQDERHPHVQTSDVNSNTCSKTLLFVPAGTFTRVFRVDSSTITLWTSPFPIRGSEVIKLFSCSTQLSMKIVMLIHLKLLTTANSVLLNIAEHENFSANKYENANYCWHFRIY